MSQTSYTADLNENEINEMIDDLRDARDITTDIEQQAFIASTFLGVVGLFTGGMTAFIAGIASLANGGYGYMLDDLEGLATSAIETLEYYKDVLQNRPEIDLVRLDITVKLIRLNSVNYRIPTDFKILGYRSNGSWMLID